MVTRQTAQDILDRMTRNWPQAVTPTAELMMRVFRLNDLVFENSRQETARQGLSFTEFEVLAALRSASPPYELAPTELYSAILISSGGLTKVLGALERRKLIGRVKDKADRRSLRVRLTPAGERLAEDSMANVLKADGDLLKGALSKGEMGALIASLRKLLLAVERPGAPCRHTRQRGQG